MASVRIEPQRWGSSQHRQRQENRAHNDAVAVETRGRARIGIAPSRGAPLKPMPTCVQDTLEALEKMCAVKNTFIDLRHCDCDSANGGHRRTVSSPPSFRSLASESTDVSDVSSEVSDGYAPTFDSDRTSQVDAGEPQNQAFPVMAVVGVWQVPAQCQTACKLSSTAKPWSPSSKSDLVPMAQLTQLSGAFATALEPAVRIVASVASKMGTICNSNVSVTQQPDGWTIAAVLKSDDAWQVKKLLEVAQASLINTSEISQRVLVVSCKPLAPHENGFRAVLGLVDDRSKACWDIFSSTGCLRGSRCHWQHPRFMRRLDVAVNFENENIDCS